MSIILAVVFTIVFLAIFFLAFSLINGSKERAGMALLKEVDVAESNRKFKKAEYIRLLNEMFSMADENGNESFFKQFFSNSNKRKTLDSYKKFLEKFESDEQLHLTISEIETAMKKYADAELELEEAIDNWNSFIDENSFVAKKLHMEKKTYKHSSLSSLKTTDAMTIVLNSLIGKSYMKKLLSADDGTDYSPLQTHTFEKV